MPLGNSPSEPEETRRADFAPRRILVALDSSRYALAAAEAAAELAAGCQAALEGLFVEDLDLVHLAGLPVARLISAPSGQARALDPQALGRHLAGEQAKARRALDAVAARIGVDCSFRVVRGHVKREIMQAALEADLLVCGLASRPSRGKTAPGSVAMEAAERGPGSVLLMPAIYPSAGNPLVVYRGSRSRPALTAAATIARVRNRKLLVALAHAGGAESSVLMAEVTEQLGQASVRLDFETLGGPTPDEMSVLLSRSGADFLIIAADDPLIEGRARRRLIERLGCSILLVR